MSRTDAIIEHFERCIELYGCATPPVPSTPAAIVAALKGLLDCPDIADNDHKDEETHAAERVARAALSALSVQPEPKAEVTEAVAKIITKWLGYSWDGLDEGRVTDRGFPVFAGDRSFQGRKGDMLALAAEIQATLGART